MALAIGCSSDLGGPQPASGAGGKAGTGGSGGSGAATASGGSGTGGGGLGGTGTGATSGAGNASGTGSSAGANTGGTGNTPGSGGTGGSAGSGGSGGAEDAYPCDGTTAGYDALVTGEGGNWVATRDGQNVYTGGEMRAAIQAGIDSLDQGRTSKQSVLVQGSGTIGAGERVNVASYTVLNVCGTMDVTGSGAGDQAPIYARARTDIEVPHATITGSPLYGMFFRDVDNLHLGRIELRVTSGLGIRIDNHGRSNRAEKVTNIQIDYVHVEGTSAQGVETYGVDRIRIGTVVARNVGEAGLLLNDTTNAEVGLVDAIDAGTGTGYAAFRTANRNGRIGDAYPTNIHVGQVVARGGGRGIFCVSESGGIVIDRIDLADTGGNSILLENCYNVNIAAQSGTVSGGGDIRIAARTEFANSADITIQNLTVTGTSINESPCADNSTFTNNTVTGGSTNVCE